MSVITRFSRSSARDRTTAEDAAPPSRRRRIAARATTTLACLFVLFALMGPNQLEHFTPEAFLRIPVEGLIGAGLLLFLPGRARRVMVPVAGLVLGLLAIVKIIDMGFFATLARPFDLVLDWPFFGNAMDFLTESVGRAGAIAAAIAAVLLAVGVVALMTLAVRRLTRIMVRHDAVATRATAVLGVAWVCCALLGLQLVKGVPVAARDLDRLSQVPKSLQDGDEFAKELRVDAFRGTPPSQMLTALRGKDVLLAFVESYGRSAIEDPRFAPHIDPILDDGTRRLRAAGYSARTAFLTSPTAGGGSWLAHSTLLSGLWIDNQQRYQTLVKTDRLTLTRAFHNASWRTLGVMPGTSKAWPEGSFFGYDKIYDRWTLGYQGPRFNWGTMPDQYTLSAFERLERAPSRAPVMAETALTSSHAPWAPLPKLVDWNAVGDGSVFNGMPEKGRSADVVWQHPSQVRTEYRHSIEYSLSSLISYVEKYGDKNLVLVFLGDHQPAPIVIGADASRDVPITIVARDPAVLDRISGWGWQDGLNPDPKAPVWRMSDFRDRFFTAFGSQPTKTP